MEMIFRIRFWIVSERFAPNKPYKVCANQERLINLELEEYDIEQNRLEEEYFAN